MATVQDNRTPQELLETISLLEEELRCFREYDVLTGLYNKDTFCRRVAEELANKKAGEPAIVCIDIERFKVINDLYGAAEGDRLLQYMGKQLGELAKKRGGLAARLTGDIFALYMPKGSGAAGKFERMVMDWLRAYPLNMELIAAIGIYSLENKSLPVSLMCDRAILALNSIKGNYLCHAAVYHSQLRSALIEEQEILNDAEHALEEREFQVYVQPKCDMRTGRIVGSEALVRWRHPRKGLIPPQDFIPLFERNGFIMRLDAYVWETVCALQRHWIDSGRRAIPISVNVSRADLHDLSLCRLLLELVERYGLPPRLLELEITESAYTDGSEPILEAVDWLRSKGFTILMDDFGSGYSSLNLLKDINVDTLKLDLRFLENRGKRGRRGDDIMESVIRMAKWLEMQIIAEGVESREQVEFLLGAGCFYAQGYYYYPPMPAEDFGELLRDGTLMDYDYPKPYDSDYISLEEFSQSDPISSALLNNLLGGVVIYEYSKGNLSILRVSDGYYRITGSTPQTMAVRGRHALDMLPEQDRPILLDALARAREQKGEGVELQFRRKRMDGRMMWMHMRLFLLSKNGERELFYGSINDITQQRESQERLKLSEQRLRLAMEATSNQLFDFDMNTRSVSFVQSGGAFVDMPSALRNVPDSLIESGFIHRDDAQRCRVMFRHIYEGEEKACCEVRVRREDGGYFWTRITLVPVVDEDGSTSRAVGLVEDITREKELEEQVLLAWT